MVRASEVHNICTNIPTFDAAEYDEAEKVLKKKVEGKLKTDYIRDNLETYLETRGIVTIAKEFKKQMEKKDAFLNEELPNGAKNYLELKWLENEMGFSPTSTLKMDNMFSLKKGTICEDDAIEVVNSVYGTFYKKNEVRKTEGFLTGECDIDDKLENAIFDIKVPESWESFRNKTGIELQYFWQLVAYCKLYGRTQAGILYVLMPTPFELFEEDTKYLSHEAMLKYSSTMDSIESLEPMQRVKSFRVDDDKLQWGLGILSNRLILAEDYYKSLTFEKCMYKN